MREILFRGKRIDTDEWIYGYYTKTKWYIKGYIHAIIPEDCCFYSRGEISDWYAIEPDTVGQYTGLYDKNGVNIFEGDIVDAYNTGVRLFIAYEREGFVIKDIDCKTYFAIYEHYSYDIKTKKYIAPTLEVIGNIHDNPELLHNGDPSYICKSTNLKCIKCNPGPCDSRKEVRKW